MNGGTTELATQPVTEGDDFRADERLPVRHEPVACRTAARRTENLHERAGRKLVIDERQASNGDTESARGGLRGHVDRIESQAARFAGRANSGKWLI